MDCEMLINISTSISFVEKSFSSPIFNHSIILCFASIYVLIKNVQMCDLWTKNICYVKHVLVLLLIMFTLTVARCKMITTPVIVPLSSMGLTSK